MRGFLSTDKESLFVSMVYWYPWQILDEKLNRFR